MLYVSIRTLLGLPFFVRTLFRPGRAGLLWRLRPQGHCILHIHMCRIQCLSLSGRGIRDAEKVTGDVGRCAVGYVVMEQAVKLSFAQGVERAFVVLPVVV